MGAWRQAGSVLHGAHRLVPVLVRSTRVMAVAVAGVIRGDVPKKSTKAGRSAGGETFGRLLVVCVVGYLLVYLTGGRVWLWYVYGAFWLGGCLVLTAARQDWPREPAAPRSRPARGSFRQRLRAVFRSDPDIKVDLDKGSGERPTPSPAETADRVAHTVIQAVSDAESAGYRGVHVAELIEILAAEGLPDFREVSPLRKWLEASHFPVSRSLKVRGKGPTWGVRADALSDALGMPLREALDALVSDAAEDDPPAPSPASPPTPPEAGPAAPAEPSADAAQELPPARHLRAVPDPSSTATG